MIIKPILPIWIMGIICVAFMFIAIKSEEHKSKLRRVIIIALLFMINLRIMIPNGKENEISTNLDIIFVIDNTISMVADDYEGEKTRIEAVKEDTSHIIDSLSRFKIFTYNF